MRPIYCTLVAYQFLTRFTVIYEGTFMMNTIALLLHTYAAGGAVGRIEETSDWSSFFTFDPAFFGLLYFYFYFFDGDLEGDFGSLSLSLLFDFPDFTDLSSPYPFFLLFESPAILNFIC